MGVVWQHVREVMQYDLSDKIVVPGFFDMHVHFRDPGQIYKEDLNSGALSAAFGGFTGVLCMPNTIPPIDNSSVLKDVIQRSKENIVDAYFACCASKDRKGSEISDIDLLLKDGAIAVTDDGAAIQNEAIMKSVLEKSSFFDKPVLQHCENQSISDGGIINEGEISRKLNLNGLSRKSEYEILERDINLLRGIQGAKYHVQHVSTAESVQLIRGAKEEGLNITSEVCPHHFTLTEKAVEDYGTNAKMNPPLRTEEDVKEILTGLKDRTIDVICTDHAPHSAEEKLKGLKEAPFGIIGLETSIGLTNTFLVEKDIITLEEMIYKMSINPRKILGLPEIKIQEGEVANLTILDLKKEWVVDTKKFRSKSKNTPFKNWKLKGKSYGILNNCRYIIDEYN